MVDIDNEFVWVEQWRPKSLDAMILPVDTKTTLKNLIKKPQKMTNLLFSGGAGIGKTTAAIAMMHEIDADYLKINASKEGDINTLRTKIQDFASKMSLGGERKFVILDEADGLGRATQPALRSFMEDFSKNCGFILTCNFKNNLIEPLHSRLAEVSFRPKNKDEKKELVKETILHIFKILDSEEVEYDRKAVSTFVMGHFPDLRKTLNELQYYSNQNGKIDEGVLGTSAVEGIDELFRILKDQKFTELVHWVQKYDDIDIVALNEKIFLRSEAAFGVKNVPTIILHLNQYEYKDKFVANKSINILAMLTEIMGDLKK